MRLSYWFWAGLFLLTFAVGGGLLSAATDRRCRSELARATTHFDTLAVYGAYHCWGVK